VGISAGHVRADLIARYNKDDAWSGRRDAFERVSNHVESLIGARDGAAVIPAAGMRPVTVLQGPLHDQIGLLGALRSHERVLVLLHLLGAEQRVVLARGAIEAIE